MPAPETIETIETIETVETVERDRSRATETQAPPGERSGPSDPGERYLNRELSWLAFNERVLAEASNPNHPLLERVRFLSISASNMDEFYMVRVSGLKGQVAAGISYKSLDGRTPSEQLAAVQAETSRLMATQQECWTHLLEELAQAGVHVIGPNKLGAADKEWLSRYFLTQVFPVLTPLAIDPSHPFPFLPNLGFALALLLTRKSDGKVIRAHVPLPSQIRRFVRLPGETIRFMALEHLVELFIDKLFPGCRIEARGTFRLIRDSDIEYQEEAEDLVRQFETMLKQRRRGEVVRLKVSNDMPADLRDLVIEELECRREDVVEVGSIVGLSQVDELIDCDRPDLLFKPFTARFPERIREYGNDCFAAIKQKDLVVHHPYESFDVVARFLEQAAADPEVVAIKQTLYRTVPNSPIVRALISAAEAGTTVTALIELKARFDEENNLKLSQDLERAGVHVVWGFMGLKTHAKISLAVRKEDGGLRSYVHYGTGNYHPITAKIYTDLSFFTCDPALGRDAGLVFNFLTGSTPPDQFEKLAVAPQGLRKAIVAEIDREIAHAKAGRPAAIWAKMNALVDGQVIEALYAASAAGVQIDLVVRGVCCLRPGVPDMSENIRVKSIVGRFLEHSRIVCFGNGQALPSEGAKIFISSADWMPRNFDRRCEVMVPIENDTVRRQVLDQIMVANMKDNTQSWTMRPDGQYDRDQPGKHPFSAHTYFMTNPSLSGRGKALQRDGGPERLRIGKQS